MKIGAPKEIKNHKYQVVITPSAVHELISRGQEVVTETDAGYGSFVSGDEYAAAGAHVLTHAEQA
jgi:alanine dehydrogenase